jgi:ribosomal protein S6--L-glutamate ligase
LVLEAERPAILYRGGLLPMPDAIIPRIGASVTDLGAAVIHQFDLMGVPSTTGAAALQMVRDKFRCMQVLAQAGIPMPKTLMVGTSDNLLQLVEYMGGLPVVVKQLESTHGEGVSLAFSLPELRQILDAYLYLDDRVIVQEFVAEAQGADIRALVVDGKVVASMRRQAVAGEFRSNLHRGATAVKVALSAHDKALVEEVAAAMDIAVAGVDLLPSARGALVMEVNASPGLEGIEGVTRVNVAGKIVQFLEKQLKVEGSI